MFYAEGRDNRIGCLAHGDASLSECPVIFGNPDGALDIEQAMNGKPHKQSPCCPEVAVVAKALQDLGQNQITDDQ